MCKSTLKCLAACTGIVAGAAAGYLIWSNRKLFLVNDITTGENTYYPNINPRVYYASKDEILDILERIVSSLPKWRVVHMDKEECILDAEVETIGGSLDDVTVMLEELEFDQVRVNIRSHSRQGRGDLGQNAQHIKELQSIMDSRLMTQAAI